MAASDLLPDKPRGKLVDAPGCRLSWFTRGERSGTPLILCHGLAAHGLQFADDASWFAEHGYFVVVPDIRGHGRSTLSDPVAQAEVSIARLASDMRAVMEAEQLSSAHWLGNSLGGIIGLALMESTPQCLDSFASFGTSYSLCVPPFALRLSALGAKLAGNRLIAALGGPMTSRTPKGRAIVSQMLGEADINTMIAMGRAVARYDLIGNALAFKSPILMLRGARDAQVNRALGRTLQAMTHRDNFTLIDLDDAGHCANLDQPELVRRHLHAFITQAD